MNSKAYFLLISIISLVLTPSRAQERAPHGLAYENPIAFSPSAVEFFHPATQQPTNVKNPCSAHSSSGCSPLPLAAQVEAMSTAQQKGGSTRLGPGGIAGIVIGLAFAVFLAMGGFYVFVTRRANENRANSVRPDA
ncbi:uncharacterized protein LOC126664659 [Mercurialis annua]|uniref:uncharacterized protein LOC126664659 n=1 Tax=Mercurialis annua TaxID=3986 RepID=UPI00215F4ACE|nr:uncharacterized protein LOC126664659 [Mercurialis annua]